jgi:hypothetical protein
VTHDIAEGIIVGKACILVFGFVQKIKCFILTIFEKLSDGLQFVVKGDYLILSSVFELECE